MAARATRLSIEGSRPTMANQPRPELSSAFDDMLAQTRKRFEDLYRGGSPRAGEPAAPVRPFVSGEVTARKPRATSAKPQADSLAAHRLNERFGSDWRYEITDQKRDGNEAIVLCKLTFGKDNAVRTQFGRARISRQSGGRGERRRAIQDRRFGHRAGRGRGFSSRRRSGADELRRSDLIRQNGYASGRSSNGRPTRCAWSAGRLRSSPRIRRTSHCRM